MKLLLVLISFVLFISYNNVQSLNIKNFLSGNSSFCHEQGYACKSCFESVLCLQHGTNFTEIPVETCGDNSTCLNGICTTYLNPACYFELQPKFVCQTSGMYPDPFDCTKYHYCIKDNTWNNATFKHFTEKCSCGYSYNMKTTFCDIPLNNNNTCRREYSLAKCSFAGENGSLQENPTLYYICRHHSKTHVLYPFLYACENGKRYNPNTYICN